MSNMAIKRLESVIFVLFAIVTLNNAQQFVYNESLQLSSNESEAINSTTSFLLPLTNESDRYYGTMIEYMMRLFCANNRTYRFNHIYVERSVSTGFADNLINHINKCMTAGVLISR